MWLYMVPVSHSVVLYMELDGAPANSIILVDKFTPHRLLMEAQVAWTVLPSMWWKLNVDGSIHENAEGRAGGLIWAIGGVVG
ncbi:hypothetical protein Ancab_014242 [Ancistrocladus abbreviatus]